MTTNKAKKTDIDGSVERRVRPVAQVQRMGSFNGVPHYGCLLNLEAEHRMKVNDPLYGQAELDAAVAAERERCIQWIEDRRITFIGEHGSADPDTGAIEFGRGPHAEAKQDYVAELEEIAAGLRDL